MIKAYKFEKQHTFLYTFFMGVRELAPGDIESLVALTSGLSGEFFTGENFLSCIESESLKALVYDEGEILGFLVFTYGGYQSELIQIAVAPDARRKGVGKALFSSMLSLISGGGESLFLEVRESNTAARAFYEDLLMRPVGKRPGFYRDPTEDALIYERKL